MTEEEKDLIKNYTGWIRKVIETKMWNESQQIDAAASEKQCVEKFYEIAKQVAGNRTEIELGGAKDAYLMVEAITRWSYQYLGMDTAGSPPSQGRRLSPFLAYWLLFCAVLWLLMSAVGLVSGLLR